MGYPHALECAVSHKKTHSKASQTWGNNEHIENRNKDKIGNKTNASTSAKESTLCFFVKYHTHPHQTCTKQHATRTRTKMEEENCLCRETGTEKKVRTEVGYFSNFYLVRVNSGRIYGGKQRQHNIKKNSCLERNIKLHDLSVQLHTNVEQKQNWFFRDRRNKKCCRLHTPTPSPCQWVEREFLISSSQSVRATSCWYHRDVKKRL